MLRLKLRSLDMLADVLLLSSQAQHRGFPKHAGMSLLQLLTNDYLSSANQNRGKSRLRQIPTKQNFRLMNLARPVPGAQASFWEPVPHAELPRPALMHGEELVLPQLDALLTPMGD